MPKVILVGGLPGSGKTAWAREQARLLGRVLIDDPRRLEDIEPYLGQDLIITDPNLCRIGVQELAIKYFTQHQYDIIWVMVALDVESALHQDRIRNRDQLSQKLIHQLAAQYHLPDGASIIQPYLAR